MIPVSIVTGFLGSGKTTLIGRLLRDGGFARTAVIVNEWGEVGLDHELIATSDETLVALTTGCLCCRMRSDIAATLLELERRQRVGEMPGYHRVLIETSGLADPAPILQALMADADVTEGHAIDTVLTLVDAQHGEATLKRHAEARRQVALADRLVLSKTDIAGRPAALLHQLRALNPGAVVLEVATSEIAPGLLFAGSDPAAHAGRLAALPFPAADPFAGPRHTESFETITLQREQPIPALALAMWLAALVEHCGSRLLRLKGIVEVDEQPGSPAIIHVVQHVVSSPEWLPRWPSANRQSYIVIIGERIPHYFPARLLDAIEEEVRRTTISDEK
jgi:G3E family GTPase